MKLEDWTKTIDAEASEGGDLGSLGAQAAGDAELSADDGRRLLSSLAGVLFSTSFGNFLEGFLERRECPGVDFWVNLILEAKDSELGGSVLSPVAPFLDLTALLTTLLERSPAASAAQKQRIALTVWAATCVVNRYWSPADQFPMKEHLRSAPVAGAIREQLRHFDAKFDRNSLQKALTALGG